jgi:hypothetical protein
VALENDALFPIGDDDKEGLGHEALSERLQQQAMEVKTRSHRMAVSICQVKNHDRAQSMSGCFVNHRPWDM